MIMFKDGKGKLRKVELIPAEGEDVEAWFKEVALVQDQAYAKEYLIKNSLSVSSPVLTRVK